MYDPPYCDSFFDVFFEVEDLTSGTYPVTRVILYINGVIQHDTGTVSTTYYSNSVGGGAECGETIALHLVGMNDIGQTVTVNETMTMPTP
jgi:hypothetical protein